MCNTLSLLPHCQKCGSKCCIPGETIGVPIVTKQEAREAFKIFGFGYFEKVVLHNGQHYCVPRKVKWPGRCIFLNQQNQCAAQKVKFADCRAYPIKAIRKEGRIICVIDIHCPAAPYLTPEFIAAAKKIALETIEAWEPEVYQHWLDHYIQWTKDALELEVYLKLSDAGRRAFPVY